MVSSDVRGRAAASVATIEGRTAIGQQVLELANDSYGVATQGSATQVVAMPHGVKVTYLAQPGAEEAGWKALAMQTTADGSVVKYLVVKATQQVWASPAELDFGDR